MASKFDEEINSLNPLRLPPDRDTARKILRYGINGTCAAIVVRALFAAWHNLSQYAATEITALQFLLAGLFVLLALWVRQKGTTWPLAILMMLATIAALSSLANIWTELLAETPKYRIIISIPNILLLVAQLHNVRALRYLLESGGDLAGSTATPAVAAMPMTEAVERREQQATESVMIIGGPKSSAPIARWWAAAAAIALIMAGLGWYRWSDALSSDPTTPPAQASGAAPIPEDTPSPAPAPADLGPPQVAGWRVAKDAANGSCEMLTTLDTEYGMTFISLNYRVFDERITFAFLAQQVAIPEGTPRVSFDFDGNKQEWQQISATRRSGDGLGTGFTADLTTDFIDAMSSHRDLVVNVNSQPIFRLDTTEAADALKQLGTCAIDIGTGG